MRFKIVGKIRNIEIIAAGREIRVLKYLQRQYGKGRWRKLKGDVTVELLDIGMIREAEVHWYESHGIGRRRMIIKRFLD